MSPLRIKILFLAVLPLVAAVIVIGWLLSRELGRLEATQERLQEEVFLAARRDELRHYVELALTSIDHLYGAGRNDEQARQEAQRILRAMRFGTDGYFFVYDTQGRNLVHPWQPELQGQQLIDLRDADGVYVIRELIARAREGGGFQRYIWPKPSTGQSSPKLGYAVQLERWGWMLGTGIYIDDIDAAAVRMRHNLLATVQGTLIALAGVAMVATLLVFAGGMALNVSEQRVANRRIRLLADRVVLSQEEERARLSRELHDDVCQTLVSVKYRFEMAADQLAHNAAAGLAQMQEAVSRLAQAIGDIRELSHGLRPPMLDDLGLDAALQQHAHEVGQRSGLSVEVSLSLPRPVSHEAAIALFRIAQEALANAERHAQARSVRVTLQQVGQEVWLDIADDGRGFDVAAVERSRGDGIGLSNMRQRAERQGGRLWVESQPGSTRVRVQVPAEPESPWPEPVLR